MSASRRGWSGARGDWTPNFTSPNWKQFRSHFRAHSFISSSMSLVVRRCCRLLRRDLHGLNTRSITSHSKSLVETDASGIPLKPTWSVHDLISSYPTPTISSATFKRLHELSALLPPPEGTPEHDKRKQELEDLIKLVEAVKLVDLDQSAGAGEDVIPDGRIWAEGTGVRPTVIESDGDHDVSGSALLQYGARTTDGLYEVDADRAK